MLFSHWLCLWIRNIEILLFFRKKRQSHNVFFSSIYHGGKWLHEKKGKWSFSTIFEEEERWAKDVNRQCARLVLVKMHSMVHDERERENLERQNCRRTRDPGWRDRVRARENINEYFFLHLPIYCLFFGTVRVLVFSIKEIRENVWSLLSLWCPFGSIKCGEIIGISIFPYVHVDSINENSHKCNESVQYLPSSIQQMAKKRSRIQWCIWLHGEWWIGSGRNQYEFGEKKGWIFSRSESRISCRLMRWIRSVWTALLEQQATSRPLHRYPISKR
jgi:hypothetical protein